MRLKLLLLLTLYAMGQLGCAGENMNEPVLIYYVPIGVETYIPMTTENFADHAKSLGPVDLGASQLAPILGSLNEASVGNFDDKAVRVKIIRRSDDPVWIDNVGGIRVAQSEYSLTSDELMKLKSILDSISAQTR